MRKQQPRESSDLYQEQPLTFEKVISLLSILFIVVSICCFCLGTHNYFQVCSHTSQNQNFDLNNQSIHETANSTNQNASFPYDDLSFDAYATDRTKTIESDCEPIIVLEITQLLCNLWFTLEIGVKIFTSPSKLDFFKAPINLIDLAATAVFYTEKTLNFFEITGIGVDLLDFLRILRIFRLFKLTRFSAGLKILLHTLYVSAGELLLLIFFLIFGIVIFSSMCYFAERIHPEHSSIIDWFWWAVATMTTVGYGDLVPKSYPGKMIGFLCAVAGVLTIALPVPVIVSNFASFYQHSQARKKLPKRRRIITPAVAKRKGFDMFPFEHYILLIFKRNMMKKIFANYI
ncbi:potassium voltage-gated channel protein Shaw-like [Convolutriloba macropyga]|uniref:potassium voltage-gated channel protein Shaw-like n=1 Tax=Convolutriloba macropyga TaxID=536237 RepID=UPI003F522369